MNALIDIIEFLTDKFNEHGLKAITPSLLIVTSFFIGISPTLTFLFLYKKELLVKYNTILVLILILSISFVFYLLIFFSTYIFSAKILCYKITKIISDKNSAEDKQLNFLITINIYLTSFVISLFSLSIAVVYYSFRIKSFKNFGEMLIIALIFVIYILISIICNYNWFKSNK